MVILSSDARDRGAMEPLPRSLDTKWARASQLAPNAQCGA